MCYNKIAAHRFLSCTVRSCFVNTTTAFEAYINFRSTRSIFGQFIFSLFQPFQAYFWKVFYNFWRDVFHQCDYWCYEVSEKSLTLLQFWYQNDRHFELFPVVCFIYSYSERTWSDGWEKMSHTWFKICNCFAKIPHLIHSKSRSLYITWKKLHYPCYLSAYIDVSCHEFMDPLNKCI